MLARILALASLGSLVLLSAILQSTTPSTIHPVGILVVFALIYVVILGVVTYFLFSSIHVIARTTHRVQPWSLKKSYYYASVLALAPVILIGMRSIGHTGSYDIVLVVVFEIVALFYLTKRQ